MDNNKYKIPVKSIYKCFGGGIRFRATCRRATVTTTSVPTVPWPAKAYHGRTGGLRYVGTANTMNGS